MMYCNTMLGRKLKTSWDINDPNILKEHQSITNGYIRTRFPPEPNGYLHLGHIKSIYMNFEEAFNIINTTKKYVIFRYDDTNPVSENSIFVNSQKENLEWLGYTPDLITNTSDYFDQLYTYAIKLIELNLAYVCFENDPNVVSKYRNTTIEENLKYFNAMKTGMYKEKEACLRLKIDTDIINPNLFDIVAYRILYHKHHKIGNKWCIYPTYDYSHCIVDSIEHIDYSICTLEFETRRELYYWILDKLNMYKPKVYEFAKLELKDAILSKRNIKELVNNKTVDSWDDPRLLTIEALKNRGISSNILVNFIKDIGITRNNSEIDIVRFNRFVSKSLNDICPRLFGVLEPILLILTNIPDDFTISVGERNIKFSNHIYIDKNSIKLGEDDKNFYGFMENRYVRLRYGPIIYVTKITENNVYAKVILTSNDSSDLVKIVNDDIITIKTKSIMHWVPYDAIKAKIIYYEFINNNNADVSKIIYENALIEKIIQGQFQLERIGYFHFANNIVHRIMSL